jgi:hypothetical protein
MLTAAHMPQTLAPQILAPNPTRASAPLKERAQHHALGRLYEGVDALAALLMTAIFCAGTAQAFE